MIINFTNLKVKQANVSMLTLNLAETDADLTTAQSAAQRVSLDTATLTEEQNAVVDAFIALCKGSI